MASLWIKIAHDLPDKEEIDLLAAALKIDHDAVIGKLVRFWIWADMQTVDPSAVRVTDVFIDRLTHCPGFAAALLKAGWMVRRNGRVSLPNFDRHNGQTAKARALTKDRVERHRNGTSVTAALHPSYQEKEKEKDSSIPAPNSSKNPSPRVRGSGGSGFSKQTQTDLTPESLADYGLLRKWFDEECRRTDGWVKDSEANWDNVRAIAAKVLHDESIRDPVAVAKWIIRGNSWDYISASHEDMARAAARDLRSAPADPIVAALAAAFKLKEI